MTEAAITAVMIIAVNVFAADWPAFRRDNNRTGADTAISFCSPINLKWTAVLNNGYTYSSPIVYNIHGRSLRKNVLYL